MESRRTSWEKMGEQVLRGLIEVDIPAKKKDPARKASCEVRFETVLFPLLSDPQTLTQKSLKK